MSFSQLFPLKDTTLYSKNPTQNTGIDSVIEVSKTSDFYPSRIIIQFDEDKIKEYLSDGNASINAPRNWKAYLRLYASEAEGIPEDFNILIDPLYQSWQMGTGRKANSPITKNGASWEGPTEDSAWSTGSFPTGLYMSESYVTASYVDDESPFYVSSSYMLDDFALNPFGTQSYNEVSGGGSWYQGYTLSQSINYYTPKDIWVDVTTQVAAWRNDDIENYGFVLRVSESFENNNDYVYHLSYFSRDTNTIYPPSLIFYFDDQQYNPDTSSILNNHEFDVSLSNNGGIYQAEDDVRFRVYGREKYPQRVFQTSSFFEYNKTLPSASQFQIVDVDTNEAVIPFDNEGTAINADLQSSYFDVDMSTLEPERYYTIQVKTKIDNNTYVKNNNAMSFKVQQKV